MPLLQSSTGRAFLSYLSRESTRAVVNLELATRDIDENEVDRIINETRANGFARVSGKLILGLHAIACPIFNIDGSIACSVSIVTTDPELFATKGPAVKSVLSAVEELNNAWGHGSDTKAPAESVI